MAPETRRRRYACEACQRSFTSRGRLLHHHAAEHAAKTSEDIARTGDHIPKIYRVSLKKRPIASRLLQKAGRQEKVKEAL